jgi:pimeloyl-ACP methyl ester carboxylesterase
MSPPIEHRFVRANDLRFHVATCGSGPKLALLLHGFPESWFSWRHQMTALAAAGYRVWAPDLRGYGASDKPSGVASYSLDTLVSDVGGLLDAARTDERTSEVVLVGHDWGGAIAWASAIARVRPLDRLIVMNCPHPKRFVTGLLSPAQLRRSWYMFFFQLPYVPERVLAADGALRIGKAFRGMAIDKSRFPDHVLDEFRRNALQPGALTGMLGYYRAMFRGNLLQKVRSFGPPIEVPTLLVWGEEDAALGKELTMGMDGLVRDLRVEYLPGVSHWVQQEAPERVNEVVLSWLADR